MRKKAFVTGYFGFGNTGDEAILRCMVSHLREIRPDLSLTVTSADPHATTSAHAVEAILWSDAQAMLDAVRSSDLIIIGGGGIFHDYWGFNPNALLTDNQDGIAFYCAPAVMAAVYGKPVMLYAVGVGPLISECAKRFTHAAAEAAGAITVRDLASKRILESIGVAPDRVRLMADPAFAFPVEPETGDFNAGRPRIAVALRPWEIGVRPDVWEREVAAALDSFLENPEASVLFVPFQKFEGKQEYDLAVAKRVRARMKRADRATIADEVVSLEHLSAILAACDLVVGMRLHSMILGAAAQVPLVALSYDPKVSRMMARVGLEDFCLDIRTLEAASLTAKIAEVLDAKPLAKLEGLADLARENARIAIDLMDRGAPAFTNHPAMFSLLGRGIEAQLRDNRDLRAEARRLRHELEFYHAKILAEQEKAATFLRSEVAVREKTIAEKNQAVRLLGDAVLHRNAALSLLRNEIDSRDGIIHDQQKGIAFLQEEIGTRDATAAAQGEGISFLREEVAQREMVISERQNAIEFLQQRLPALEGAIAVQLEGIAFLRGEVAQRERTISAQKQAIAFMKQEGAVGDAGAAAQIEGIAFLREEAAQREKVISAQQRAIEFLRREVAAQGAGTAAHIEGISFLREEVAQSERTVSAQQKAIAFMKQEGAVRDAGAAAQIEGITFLREEAAQREKAISAQQRAIEFLRREVAAQGAGTAAHIEGITFLREEVAQRERAISEHQSAIEFLQREVAARDAGAAAQVEGIAFLRSEVAQREAVTGERELQLLRSEDEITRLLEAGRAAETKLSRLGRWQVRRSRREKT